MDAKLESCFWQSAIIGTLFYHLVLVKWLAFWLLSLATCFETTRQNTLPNVVEINLRI